MVSTFSYVKPEAVDAQNTLRYGLSAEQVKDLPDAIKQTLMLHNGSQSEVNKVQISKAIQAFQRFPGDTGSSEVQVAVLTQKILYLTEHMKQNRKDVHSRRGLVAMVNQRKSLLKYLKKNDLQKFKAVLGALNIRFR